MEERNRCYWESRDLVLFVLETLDRQHLALDFFQTAHGRSWLSRCEHLLSHLVSSGCSAPAPHVEASSVHTPAASPLLRLLASAVPPPTTWPTDPVRTRRGPGPEAIPPNAFEGA